MVITYGTFFPPGTNFINFPSAAMISMDFLEIRLW